MKVEKKRNKKIWIFAVVVILVAALGVVFAYKLGQQKSVNNSNGVVVDQNASDWDKDLDNLSGQQDWQIRRTMTAILNTALQLEMMRLRFMSLTILNRERQSVNFRSIRRWMKEIIQYI